MGIDQLSRRCACGVILRAREGCQRCADKARARLHAEGVCKTERKPWSEYDDCRLRLTKAERVEFERTFFAMDPGYRDTTAVVTATVFHGGTMRIDDIKQIPAKHEPPPVGAEVSYEVALEDMKRRQEARYNRVHGATKCYSVHPDGTLMMQHNSGWYRSVNTHDQNAARRWVRLPDAIPYTTLPAVGAEVSWEVAKRDMQARKEARYRPTCSPGHEYAWASQLVLRELGGLWQSADWSDDVEGQLRWARLA